MKSAVVLGAGGFIGHHLVKYLKERGYEVGGVDIHPPMFEKSAADVYQLGDLRRAETVYSVMANADEVYNLAADMGGIGYITSKFADIVNHNVRINLNVLTAARLLRIPRVFYSSSACVYPSFLQDAPEVTPLREEQAIPADPEKGYGWEKLFSEQLYRYFAEDYGLQVRVARFHNVYGPLGTYDGGKEKAPAALCRKIALAEDGDEIEVWGDGQQTRSFLYVDDCVEGIYRLMQSDYDRPLNLGSDVMVSVNHLVDMISNIAEKKIRRRHDLTKPQGVRGRNSDNMLMREVLGWEPKVALPDGLEATYRWIEKQVK